MMTQSRTTSRTTRRTERGRRESERPSRAAQRAKWIDSPDDKPDRNGQTLATRNHDVIRRWAEERDGRPAAATFDDDGRPRVLRFDFDRGNEGLKEISWDDWFRVFDERKLSFVFQ